MRMHGFWAALHNEFSKYSRQKFPYLGMIAVMLLAFFWPKGVQQIAGPRGETNAFDIILKGLISAVTSVIPFFGVIFGSILVAGETAGGTYRNILTRPIRRGTFLTAKIVFAFGYVLLLVLLFLAVIVPLAHSQLQLGPIVDDGTVIYPLPRILGVSLWALLLSLIPLFAIVSYAVFVSTAAKSLTTALGLGVGLVIAIEPVKYLIRWGEWELSDYVFTSYRDTALKIADQAACGFDYQWLPGGWWASELGWGLTLALVSMAIFLAGSYWIFLRRDLNFS